MASINSTIDKKYVKLTFFTKSTPNSHYPFAIVATVATTSNAQAKPILGHVPTIPSPPNVPFATIAHQ